MISDSGFRIWERFATIRPTALHNTGVHTGTSMSLYGPIVVRFSERSERACWIGCCAGLAVVLALLNLTLQTEQR